MSWSLGHTGPAKHTPSVHEKEVERVSYGRNGHEQTAMRATVPLVEALVKHAHLTDLHATIGAAGHHNDDGAGYVTIRVDVHQPPPPPTTPGPLTEPVPTEPVPTEPVEE